VPSAGQVRLVTALNREIETLDEVAAGQSDQHLDAENLGRQPGLGLSGDRLAPAPAKSATKPPCASELTATLASCTAA
jgi:hypothetical protein